MVGFHRAMIPQFAQYSTILTDLTKKHARWKWTSQHQEAFDKLRTVLSTDVMQHHPDLNKPYEVYSDASATAVGAVLIQRDERDRPRPVQYLSRTLNKTQRLWPAMEREAYAIIVALQTFRPYLYGAQFVVYTDHKPLRAMFQGEVKTLKCKDGLCSLQSMACLSVTSRESIICTQTSCLESRVNHQQKPATSGDQWK